MEAKFELVKSWLDKSKRDLDSAMRLAGGSEPFYDTAIYHCHQAFEKAIKGWLVFHNQRFEKTHDLRLLVALCIKQNSDFTWWQEAAESLTPYATAFRYPGDWPNPKREEFENSYEFAETFYQFVCANLPPEVSVR